MPLNQESKPNQTRTTYICVCVCVCVCVCAYEGGCVFDLRYPSWEIDTGTRVQILDVTDCLSRCTNNLLKGMNPIILPLPDSYEWIIEHNWFFSLG